MPMVAEDVVDILDRLAAAGVSVSVAGGWAIEALLGRVTRDHGDLDLAVDATDVDRAIEAMAVSGLRIEVDERPARLALGDGRRAVDLHPVRWDARWHGSPVDVARAASSPIRPGRPTRGAGSAAGRCAA